MTMVTLDPALAWSMFVALVALVFAAGGVFYKLNAVDKRTATLDGDLRKHMKDESDQWVSHLTGHPYGNE
jgi:hypothetical protein